MLLSELERARRLVVVAGIWCVYAGVYVLLLWHGCRIAETECSVIRVAGGAYCTVSHDLNGQRYTLPYDDCEHPSRWPNPKREPAQVGSKLHCFYYPSWPDNIFFEARADPPVKPVPVLVLAAALGFLAYAMRRRGRAHAALAAIPKPPLGDVYRQPSLPEPDARPPLLIPLEQRGGCGSWIMGGPFLVLGLIIMVLSAWLAWQGGGVEMVTAFFGLMLFMHVPALAGAFAVFYRSGLCFDADNGWVVYWWGLFRPWFHKHRSFDALRKAEVEREAGGRYVRYYLALDFADEKPVEFERMREDAERDAAQIEVVRSGNRD